MNKIFFAAISVGTLLLANTASAVQRVEVGHGTSMGGFCFWTAFIDTYSDGTYKLYYEVDCGANGPITSEDFRRGTKKTLEQMKAETIRSPQAQKAGRDAVQIAKTIIREEKLAAPRRTAAPMRP